ncbi:MAG: adenylosuccinate lyase [Mycoplasmatales bacterium]
MINRYQNEVMKNIWSEQNKFQAWLEVEVAACEAFGELGEIPQSDIKKIRENASFDIDLIAEIEKETRHDVVAFTRAVSQTLGAEKKWVHYGLTSTDVVDTANGFLIKQANEVIEVALVKFIQVLKKQAQEHKYTIQMGRTHGVHAELTTFGYKMALYYEEMQRNMERWNLARTHIEAGKISGAVGTYANIEPFVETFVCQKLGINAAKISTQTLQRDRHAFYFSVLTSIANTLDKIAVELRHLQRTEVREVEEGFKKGQKGSSAMPHKKNPISSENISGLARVIRGYNLTAQENVALWHERDISHSSTERIILPDATSLIEYMLIRFTKVVENLNVKKENMLKNIQVTNNVFFSQRVLLSLIEKGYSREEAYDLVQPIALTSFNNNEDFKENIKLQVNNILTTEEFEACFKNDYHLKNIDYVYERLGLNE